MKIIALSKKEFDQHIKQSKIYSSTLKTPAGTLSILSTDEGIFHASYKHSSNPKTTDKEIDFLTNSF